MNLSDKDFIHQFERKTLPAAELNHYGHLRMAWLYLNGFPLDTAIEKITEGIEAFALSLGATEKYHHTLTEAIVRIMYLRIQPSRPETLDEFLSDNPDLVDNITGVVLMYYSEDRLNSSIARQSFLPPDIKDF